MNQDLSTRQDWPVKKGHCQLAIRLEENSKRISSNLSSPFGPRTWMLTWLDYICVAEGYLISLQDRSLCTDPPSPQEKSDLFRRRGAVHKLQDRRLLLKYRSYHRNIQKQ